MLGSSKKDVSAPKQTISSPAAPAASPSPTETKMNALLGKGSEFEGKLSFEGTVQIDGIMKGEVHSKDKLVIGESAKVEAELEIGTAIVSGEVEGNITAKSRIELKSPARVKGNISTPVLIIEEGVTFDGNCSMGGTKSSSAKPATTDAPSSTGPSTEKSY